MKDIDARTANYKSMLKPLEQQQMELPLLLFRTRFMEPQSQMNYENEHDIEEASLTEVRFYHQTPWNS